MVTVLSEKYRLDSQLGRGGMASVWRAEHLALGAPVAVKLLDPEIAATPEALRRFQKEAHAAAMIRSPNVVQVLDHGVDAGSGQVYIVMELLEGETLGERLQVQGCLSLAETLAVVLDVGRALSRMHDAGIVHRDLKPDNVFLVDDDPEYAKVLDFGIAKNSAVGVDQRDTTKVGVFGTPHYMSPEQIAGSGQIDRRSDLWSLAVMVFECVMGRLPFEGDTIDTLAMRICAGSVPSASPPGSDPTPWDEWIARGLARDLERRFQTARELSDALAQVSERAGDRANVVGGAPGVGAPEAPIGTMGTESTLGWARGGARDSAEKRPTRLVPLGSTAASKSDGRRPSRWDSSRLSVAAALLLLPAGAWGLSRLLNRDSVAAPARAAAPPTPVAPLPDDGATRPLAPLSTADHAADLAGRRAEPAGLVRAAQPVGNAVPNRALVDAPASAGEPAQGRPANASAPPPQKATRKRSRSAKRAAARKRAPEKSSPTATPPLLPHSAPKPPQPHGHPPMPSLEQLLDHRN